MISHLDYIKVLEKWVQSAAPYLHHCPGRQDLMCYGSGYNGWGTQTTQKAFAAFAILATEPEFDEKAVGMPQEQVLGIALSLLRFNLASHHVGDYHCLDGTKWGHTWISALGVERMMHGVEAVYQYLSDKDKKMLRKMLLSECDWLIDHYAIVAGPIENNKPESNIWNGAILHRAASMYPDIDRIERYQEKGTKFLINGISVPDDALSQKIIDGKPVGDWFINNNFFDTYSLNHHGYLNVGYMVICLSNIAMLHFTYKRWGQNPPEVLYHHVKELCELVKLCTFADGRLLRIGGDTRVRYCYCQDYVIPMWIMMADLYQEEKSGAWEKEWLSQVAKEVDYNGDGSFLGARCCELAKLAPLYYTRLESDRAVSLSMGAYYRRIFELGVKSQKKVNTTTTGEWADKYHGACLHKSDKRIASWTVRGGEGAVGLCLPTEKSDMAEWRRNLAGEVRGSGQLNSEEIVNHQEKQFTGGFVACATTLHKSESYLAESQGAHGNPHAIRKVVFAALPDDTSVVVMQYARALYREYLSSLKGLFLQVPNDLFNNNVRTYFSESGSTQLQGPISTKEVLEVGSNWINIDDYLGVTTVYGDEALSIYRPGKRQIGIKPKPGRDNKDIGMLYADEICSTCQTELQAYDKNSVLLDLGVVLQAGVNHKETYSFSTLEQAQAIKMPVKDLRAMLVTGFDSNQYLIVANLHDWQPIECDISLAGKELKNLVNNKVVAADNGEFTIKIAPGAEIYQLL